MMKRSALSLFRKAGTLLQLSAHAHPPASCGGGDCSSSISSSSSPSPSFMSSRFPSASFFVRAAGAAVGKGAGSSGASLCEPRRHNSNSNSSSSGAAHNPYAQVHVEYPIVQLPARTLWMRHKALAPDVVARGEFADMIARVKASRAHYQYPSLCAPQIGWNVLLFALFDGTVCINAENLDELEWRREAAAAGVPWVEYEERKMEALRRAGRTCFAWEPCASCAFTMHYIERPRTVRLRYLSERGAAVEERMDLMRARMALHELDHLQGVLFTRRVVDSDHVVPLEGFTMMSDWSDDYPSLEARSTFLYTLFTPPFSFVSDTDVTDANLLDRKFEDGVYPGCEFDRQQQIESVAYEEMMRRRWRKEKKAGEKTMQDGVGEPAPGTERE